MYWTKMVKCTNFTKCKRQQITIVTISKATLECVGQSSCFLPSSVGCRLVFVPSQRDIHHHFIYPQPPFTLPNLSKDQAQVRQTVCWEKQSFFLPSLLKLSAACEKTHIPNQWQLFLNALQRVTLVPDPCTLLIDGVTFGLTSTDILFHMGAEEISWWGILESICTPPFMHYSEQYVVVAWLLKW